jgi:tetratricopeptide (TPR) repeat protein
VFHDVYWEKIHRRVEHFIAHRLGAWETILSVTKTFFFEADVSQLPLVSKKNVKGFLLNDAGVALLNTGRSKEAEDLFERAITIATEEKGWKLASAGCRNLSDLLFRIGEIEKGLEAAKRAFEIGERGGPDDQTITSIAYVAYIFRLLGKNKSAGHWFRQAGKFAAQRGVDWAYGLRGVFYADFLISVDKIDEALGLARLNLEICKAESAANDISRCHRCLAAIERIKANYGDAEAGLQKALELARKVGMPELQIEALLEYGRLHLDEGEYKDAINAANEVLKLCQRTGFLLYEPDAEVVLARAYLAQKDFAQAKTFANSARAKAKKMGYKLAENDAAKVLKEIAAKK